MPTRKYPRGIENRGETTWRIIAYDSHGQRKCLVGRAQCAVTKVESNYDGS